MESVAAAASSKLLSLADYVVIGAMVLVSAGVALYYGTSKKKQSSPPFEYFLAGRKMTLIPVALSAFATGIGPGTMIGTPTESYNYGMQIVWWCLMELLIAFILNWIFIPVYHKVGSMNINKFLEVRYNKTTKNIASLVAVVRSILQGSNNVFATAIALNRATNIDLWLIIGTIIGICVLYTSLGGMKGVMWSDVIQAIVMVLSFLTIIIMGLIYVGGIGVVWQRSYDSGRLDIFDFNTDPTVRHTFWTSTIGYFFLSLANFSTSQIIHQRYLTAPTIKDAKRGNMLRLAVYMISSFFIQIIGLIIYAEYYSCDPMKSKTIRNINQLLPTFVMKVMAPYPILPGLFFAGLLAASLSTISSAFNSGPAILFESFVQPLKPNMSARQANIICKLLCVFIGLMNCLFIFATKNFPNVKQASISISAIISGPLMILVLFGLLLPQASFKAALSSLVSGILVSTWIVSGTLLVKHPQITKPLSIEGCFVANTTFTTVLPSSFGIAKSVTEMGTRNPSWSEYFPLYSISYLWISTIAIFVSSIVFVIMSQIFEKDDSRSAVVEAIPEALQSFHRSLSKPLKKVFLCDIYNENMPDEKEENFL